MSAQTKKPNALLAAINRAVPIEEPRAAAEPHKSSPKPKVAPSAQRPSRMGTKLVAGHFDPKIARQLRMIAVEEDTTVQALLEEALDLLFVKKGKAHLSEITGG
jgi:antitoxin-like ribbon-helix-helix protein